MRQLALCGYCRRPLCDAFEVDHLNEIRTDDAEHNLVAACALCHAVKTRHVRLSRDWSHMKRALDSNLAMIRGRWQDGASWTQLPEWLQIRVTRSDARVYALSLCQTDAMSLDQFRYRKGSTPAYRIAHNQYHKTHSSSASTLPSPSSTRLS